VKTHTVEQTGPRRWNEDSWKKAGGKASGLAPASPLPFYDLAFFGIQ